MDDTPRLAEPRQGLTFERVGGGWVVVDSAGTICTPTPMGEHAASGFARVLGIAFPGDRPGR